MNILLNGANGRMGNEVIKAIHNRNGYTIVCGVGKKELNADFPIYNDISKIKEKVDVIIDFSVPEATLKILEYANYNNIPVVIATTGFNDEEVKKIEENSKKIPIFKSSNMSVDIYLMSQIVQKVAQVLSESDIEIVEAHHNKKIDSPSGTAIMLADAINKVFKEKKIYNFDRMQRREKRSKNEIGFSSIRGGNIIGEHSVMFFGENESFEIKHTSYSRQVFAEGALKATDFILNQKPGLYTMEDMLK